MVHIPRWQVILTLLVLIGGIFFASPNLFKHETLQEVPGWVPKDQINLGLDLQGGSYLLLEVDVNSVFAEQAENLVDSLRPDLRREKLGYVELGTKGDDVTFQLTDPSDENIARARELLRNLAPESLITQSDGIFDITDSDAVKQRRRGSVLEQAIEVIGRRLNPNGTVELSIQSQGEDRILIQLPGVQNTEDAKRKIEKTAKLTFRFVDENANPGARSAPPGSEFLLADESDVSGGTQRYVIKKRVIVGGETLVDAQATFQDGQPVVSFAFDSSGAKRFGDATKNNVGRPFAIVLDDKVVSAPVIRSPILDGRGIISGSFTLDQTQELALLLRAGALPASIAFLEERSVGPGLGADQIRAGEFASVLGLILVIIFMAVTYGLFGLMANVALVMNLVLILAALSGLGATLTLPGIAGIVLTIGMAVDANVLIFERIREEAGNGRSPISAIDAGYRRALTTIVDSNLTTLIAALLLLQFGTGPIKGFAVTLAIGLVTSMFTAIMLTRLLVVTWLRRRRPQALGI
ncbi:protein translocase subunit SecD [Pelagibius sp. Alg239-R121]|uniref:protein translocase subunit SecD n=1 Tax=Pelagibius sp. Alg239-R121 TaxID=2993448 RepID=UPI0024A73276|nr:protein translocase subunit SecD [Pelagibius sp. Alg239-R121]